MDTPTDFAAARPRAFLREVFNRRDLDIRTNVTLRLLLMQPKKYSSNAARQAAYRARNAKPEPPLPSIAPALLSERPVTVLFTCKVSHYDKLPCVETYDSERDARTWTGGTPIVAHPPCAQWGRLHHLATVNPEEKALGPFAVSLVRANGGVLEHPAGSKLWPATGLPAPGERDEWGGFTLDVDQVVWGHPAQKRTWFYVCGCRPEEVPPIPAPGAVPTHRVTSSAQTFHRLPELSKHLRELTPPRLAAWLVAVARLCNPPEKGLESSFELTAAPASDR